MKPDSFLETASRRALVVTSEAWSNMSAEAASILGWDTLSCVGGGGGGGGGGRDW